VLTTPTERAQILRDFERSGLAIPDFAARLGMPSRTLEGWLSKVRIAARKASAGASYNKRLDIQVFDPNRVTAVGFELRLRDSLIVQVPAGFDGAELRRLLATLESPC
jgi:transposase-like protein